MGDLGEEGPFYWQFEEEETSFYYVNLGGGRWSFLSMPKTMLAIG